MSENVTLETIVDDDEAIFDEGYDHSEEMAGIIWAFLRNFEVYYNALIIVIGIPSNILALLLLVRRRLWHQHEAYVYVAAILIINIVEMVVHHSNQWLEHTNHRFLRFPTIADITCKVWAWAAHMIICLNWLHVLMLLNIYFRQQLMMSRDRRGCFLNLADKYCSLLGTKVVLISFFTFCTVAFLFNFAISSLRVFGEFRACTLTVSYINMKQFQPFVNSIFWLGMDVPILVGILLILLIVWKKKRSSGFLFSQMDGVSQDNGDVEAMTKMFLCCAVVFLVLRAPLSLVHAMHTLNNASYTYNIHFHVAIYILVLIRASSPLSTPIVCVTVRSRFRDELRTMVVGYCRRRCCPATGRHGMLPVYQEASDNGGSVLQMDPIHEDLKITENEE